MRGVIACARHLLTHTRGKLLINALLPRGDKRKRGRHKGSGFMSDLGVVNARLNASIASELHAAFPGRVRFVDCGAAFLLPAASRAAASPSSAAAEVVERSLLPDRLHPNAAGHRLWARCLEPQLVDMDHSW